MKLICSNIRRIISSKGMKNAAIAERASIPSRAFSDMLCGRKIIRPEHLVAIADALEVTPNDLYGMNTDQTA